MHFIAAELPKRGKTRFFSFGFSLMSKVRGRDPRLGLEARANRVESVDGVDCFLWWTPVHPGNVRKPWAQPLAAPLFELYRLCAPPILRDWVIQSTTILIESGIGVLLIEDIRRWNPDAELIYIASDDMETIAIAPYLQRVFERAGHLLNGARVPSKRLAPVIPAGPKVFYVPHGVDPELDAHADPSPYAGGINAVSVGSMLFDSSFFHIATEAFPEVTFHVIGSGVARATLPKSVVYYEEMPFRRTLPFVKHARFGVAPYSQANVPYYLADTSMKLMQYDHFGLPAVCPDFVVGDDHPLRCGYRPGDPDSIHAAITAALATQNDRSRRSLSWDEVVERILEPGSFPETNTNAIGRLI
jgi:2-beta-glucuronyltransferase